MSELHKFLFDGLPVRGIIVRLDTAWQEVLTRRAVDSAWPPFVESLMGQMAAASLLMQSNIKFNGALVFQISGDGPLKLAVAEAQPSLQFRVTAKLQGEVSESDTLQTLANQRGRGRCAITLDPQNRMPGQQPYQGVVGLEVEGQENADLAAVLEQYMRQSEQLETKIVLAANGSVAAGILIQRIPAQGENNLEGKASTSGAEPTSDDTNSEEDAFERIAILAASITEQELLELDSDTILHRLFWQEPVLRYRVQTPSFACSCSLERVGNMLISLGKEETDSIIAEQGSIDIDCDFCGAHYRFDAVEAAQLFKPALEQVSGGTSLH